MKKILFAAILFSLSLASFSQTPTAKEKEDGLLETIGSSTSIVLYNSFLAIDLAKTGFEGSSFKQGRAIEILNIQVEFMKAQVEVFTRNLKANVFSDPADQAFVKDATSILTGLEKQAKAAAEFINSKQDFDGMEYERIRSNNWNKIEVLLGLD